MFFFCCRSQNGRLIADLWRNIFVRALDKFRRRFSSSCNEQFSRVHSNHLCWFPCLANCSDKKKCVGNLLTTYNIYASSKKINTKFDHFCNKILQCLQQNSRIVCIYFLCMQKGEAIAHNNCTQTYLSLQSLYTNALFNHAKFFNWNWHQHDSDIGWGFLFAAPLFFNIPASPHFHSINLIRLSMARRWWLNSYTLFNIHNQVSTLHGCLLCFAIFLQFFVFFFVYFVIITGWWCCCCCCCISSSTHITYQHKNYAIFHSLKSKQIFVHDEIFLMRMQFQWTQEPSFFSCF